MRAIVTGQVGIDKSPYLEAVKKLASDAGHDLAVFHVGKMMYEEAPDVPAGRILNIPISRLNSLRRAVFKEILRQSEKHDHVLINTHATFRWRHGLFAAFDFDQVKAFDADIYLTLLDNAESVHQRLSRDHDIDHTLKDIMVWREHDLPLAQRPDRADNPPPDVREPQEEGLPLLPHVARHGHAGHAAGNRSVQGRHQQAFHHLRSRGR